MESQIRAAQFVHSTKVGKKKTKKKKNGKKKVVNYDCGSIKKDMHMHPKQKKNK